MPTTRVGAAIVVLVLLGTGALVRPARVPVLVVLLALLALATVLWSRGRPLPIEAWVAASIPVAVTLVWGGLEQPISVDGDCENPLARVALWRAAELVAVAMGIGLVVVLRSLDFRGLIPFTAPSPRLVALLAAVTTAAAVASLTIGPIIAQGWFGEFRLLFAPIALVPAVVFGLSNALAEEVAYRGVLRGGLIPVLGVTGANVAQAAIFALAHAGPDFVASPLPVLALMFAGSLVAGAIVARTGSLLVPIALHAAFDLPIFLYWACRIT